MPRIVADNLERQFVDRQTVLIPRMSRGGRPYIKGTVSTDFPASYQASTISTSQKSISMAGLACRYVIDDQAAEDSAILAIPTLQKQIVMDLNDAMEDAIINGDSAAVHQDAIALWDIRGRWGTTPALGSSSDHRRLFTGLRAAALDRACFDDILGAGYTFADFLTAKSNLGEMAVMDMICIASPEAVVTNLLSLDQVQTLDVFGPQATVKTGQIASLAGVPIIMSRFMGADLNATGLYTGAGVTTGMLFVHTNSWRIFERRGILVESQRDIGTGSTELVATRRATLNTLDLDATKNVCYQYNMLSA